MSPQKFLGLLIVGLVALAGLGGVQAAQDFASPLFAQRWQQDEQIVQNFWGPLATAHPGQDEPYGGGDVCRPPRQCPANFPDNPGAGHRLVQYFDKGRMELNAGTQGNNVTSGLLVRELISGRCRSGTRPFRRAHPPLSPLPGTARIRSRCTATSGAGLRSPRSRRRGPR